MTGDGALARILGALAAASSEGPSIAVGWATVELDRAASGLATDLGIVAAAFLPAADSVVLGARCRVAYGILPDGQPLAILEPLTEGRLAAFLARFGEGPAATWTRSARSTQVPAGRRGAPARPGPFGFERLLPSGLGHGTYALLIEDGPGTILE